MVDFGEYPLDLFDDDGDGVNEMCLLFDEDGKNKQTGSKPPSNSGCGIDFEIPHQSTGSVEEQHQIEPLKKKGQPRLAPHLEEQLLL